MSANKTADGAGRTAGLTESERHRLLAVERRRLAIEVLADESPPTDLEALATEIAAREGRSEATNRDSVEHIKITLHHNHLPTLAELGVIDYDPKSHHIHPTGKIVNADCRQ